jgi:ABC-type branched-subunit amino acid transport system substrate-binding protein
MHTMFVIKRGFGRVLAATTMAALLAAGCGSDGGSEESSDTTAAKSDFVEVSGVPGVTDEEIRFSIMGTSTAKSPLGECFMECFADGVKAYFDYVNANGGVYGRDLVLDDPLDDELGKSQQVALQVIAADDTLATFLVPLVSTAYEPFAKANWPVYGYLTDHTAKAGKKNLFSTYSVSSFNTPRLDHPYLPQALGAKKLGALGYGVASSQTCVKQIEDEFEGIYKDVAEVVYANDDLPFGLANGVAPEVTAMKEAGVELVFTCMESNGLKTFAQEMKRQGVKAPLVTYSAFEPEFIEANAAVIEGSIQGTRLRPEIASDSEGSKLFEEWTEKADVAKVTSNTRQGWAAADLMVSGLKGVGGAFDRQKLIDATNVLKQWNAKGFIAPVDIGRQHVGSTPTDRTTNGDMPLCFSYTQIKDGKLTFIEPQTKDKPYVCWSTPNYDYEEPTATDFD